MKFTIECRISKKGNSYLCLCFGKWVVSVDDKTIVYIAEKSGYSKRDIYLLDVGEAIIIEN